MPHSSVHRLRRHADWTELSMLRTGDVLAKLSSLYFTSNSLIFVAHHSCAAGRTPGAPRGSRRLPAVDVNTCGPQIILGCHIAFLRSSSVPGTLLKLGVEDNFRNSVIWHACKVTATAQLRARDYYCFNACRIAALKDFCLCLELCPAIRFWLYDGDSVGETCEDCGYGDCTASMIHSHVAEMSRPRPCKLRPWWIQNPGIE